MDGIVISFLLNGAQVESASDPEKPLLWVLREDFGLTGTKFGCGVAACGACSVIVDGRAVRSCVTPLADMADKDVKTIEGMRDADNPVQAAWITHQTPQCGYCQSGMIMAVEALLASNPDPTDAEIDAEITNICRCGAYSRIRAAIHTAARAKREG